MARTMSSGNLGMYIIHENAGHGLRQADILGSFQSYFLSLRMKSDSEKTANLFRQYLAKSLPRVDAHTDPTA